MVEKKVLVFGSNGLVGSSCVRVLNKSPKVSSVFASSRKDTDLFSFEQTKKTIEDFRPDVVINAAAKVGGILANNTFRTEFLLENLKINMNILESLMPYPEIQIINLGSSCIYPLNAKNPISEDEIFNGKLEPTNSPYAVAKLSSIELADAMKKQFNHNVINLMPTNLYGPNDNFSEKYLRPNEVDYLLGDSSKARSDLNWKPKLDFKGLVKLMVDFDMKEAERERVLIENNLLQPTWEYPT